MNETYRIEFHEVSANAIDFLHELRDPALLRTAHLPPRASIELKKQQIARLRENVVLLREKREEFNRKMDVYVENLRSLIRSIDKSLATQEDQAAAVAAEDEPATFVQCLGCDSQRLFRQMQIIFAKESDDSLALPTEVYILDGESLKKGLFRCEACGESGLVIRSI